VSRRGELVVAQVSPPVRVLCALVATGIGWLVFVVLSRGEILVSLPFAAVALAFGAVAFTGVPTMVTDPEASERFHALADPARPLDEPGPLPGGSKHG
jgi:hypothetical protein